MPTFVNGVENQAPSGAAGGELGGTYPNPTVDATHSGTPHHTAFVQADHDALANPHHSNANDHANSEVAHSWHTLGIATHPAAAGMSRAGGNTTEATTTSTSAVDLLTISSLSIAAATPVLLMFSARKTAGAASGAGLGLTVNATVTAEASIGSPSIWTTSTTNQAEGGAVALWLTPRVTNYQVGSPGQSFRVASTGGYVSVYNTVSCVLTNNIPIATITTLVVRGITSASVTLGADEAHVYALATS